MHTYTLDGTKILREAWTENGVAHSIKPMYDNEDGVCGIQYDGVPYYFQKNLQGDIIAIVDKEANTVVRYTYDAWGVCTITQDISGCGIAQINPYRYRGYYYDAEIEMYYLQSRYYSMEVCRFANGDDGLLLIVSQYKNQNNLIAYCENEPINKIDQFGFASYENSKVKKKGGVFNITSVIGDRWTKLTYKYKINNGVIQFYFDSNCYWSVLWRGWAKTLATAMYKAAKSISNSYLKGRTITGLHIELFAHWALYKVGIKPSSTERADMGGCWGTGYDSNAWVFETAHIITKIAKINIYNVWAYYSLLLDIARYF